ncbi:MAG: MotA/TolQ/ExbB proton channel family protein [Pseudomonadota bacterium]
MMALFGILLTIALLTGAALLNGAASAYVNTAGLMVVMLGTITVTIASFRREEVLRFPSALFKVLFAKRIEPIVAASSVIQLAQKAKRDGALALQSVLPSLQTEPVLHRAVSMVVDAMPQQDIEDVLALEAIKTGADEQLVSDVMHKAGQTAPALGLIGTLIGLVQMLGQLNDPAALGPAMAVALLTTFYGAFLAHVVCHPIAAIAERNMLRGRELNAIYIAAAKSMTKQENPNTLASALEAIVPAAAQLNQAKSKRSSRNRAA